MTDREAPRVLRWLVGLVCAGIALLLFASMASVLGAYVRSTVPGPGLGDLLAMSPVLAVGSFFAVLGYRLLRGRGARRGGGVLSPEALRLIGVLFAAPIAVTYMFWIAEIREFSVPTLLFLLLCGMIWGVPTAFCFVAASRRARVASETAQRRSP